MENYSKCNSGSGKARMNNWKKLWVSCLMIIKRKLIIKGLSKDRMRNASIKWKTKKTIDFEELDLEYKLGNDVEVSLKCHNCQVWETHCT
jgi:hypothetical protein